MYCNYVTIDSSVVDVMRSFADYATCCYNSSDSELGSRKKVSYSNLVYGGVSFLNIVKGAGVPVEVINDGVLDRYVLDLVVVNLPSSCDDVLATEITSRLSSMVSTWFGGYDCVDYRDGVVYVLPSESSIAIKVSLWSKSGDVEVFNNKHMSYKHLIRYHLGRVAGSLCLESFVCMCALRRYVDSGYPALGNIIGYLSSMIPISNDDETCALTRYMFNEVLSLKYIPKDNSGAKPCIECIDTVIRSLSSKERYNHGCYVLYTWLPITDDAGNEVYVLMGM